MQFITLVLFAAIGFSSAQASNDQSSQLSSDLTGTYVCPAAILFRFDPVPSPKRLTLFSDLTWSEHSAFEARSVEVRFIQVHTHGFDGKIAFALNQRSNHKFTFSRGIVRLFEDEELNDLRGAFTVRRFVGSFRPRERSTDLELPIAGGKSVDHTCLRELFF